MPKEDLDDFAEIIQGYCKLLVYDGIYDLAKYFYEHETYKVREKFYELLQASNKLTAKGNTLKFRARKLTYLPSDKADLPLIAKTDEI